MIKQPSEIANIDKKIRILIAGYPGIGKTTIGLSAPNPLLIDVDKGLDRASASHRKAFIHPENYEELRSDLKPENLKDYETLVFDTGGQLFKLLGEWAKKKPGGSQSDGTLTQKGYGIVGREFEALMNFAYYDLNKNVVVVFHAKESSGDDNAKLRILVEGMTKDNVWQPMDLGGFVEMQGRKRVITFENNERHYGKCCHGIESRMEIPDLRNGEPNDFLTKIFAQANENIKKDIEIYEAETALFNETMSSITGAIETITDLETAKQAAKFLETIPHVKTSKTEMKAMFKKKIEGLNIEYSKEKGDFVVKNADDTKSA